MSRTACLHLKNYILEGTMLVIDPSSGGTSQNVKSNAGYALFKKGRLFNSGIIHLDHGEQKQARLQGIAACMQEQFDSYDILAIEDIDGRHARQVLIQACGAFIANTDASNLIEMNVQTWQAIAKRIGGWTKGDEEDAIYIGWSCIAFALGYNQKDTEIDREKVLMKVRKLM